MPQQLRECCIILQVMSKGTLAHNDHQTKDSSKIRGCFSLCRLGACRKGQLRNQETDSSYVTLGKSCIFQIVFSPHLHHLCNESCDPCPFSEAMRMTPLGVSTAIRSSVNRRCPPLQTYTSW